MNPNQAIIDAAVLVREYDNDNEACTAAIVHYDKVELESITLAMVNLVALGRTLRTDLSLKRWVEEIIKNRQPQ